jgi:prepilin signal peptidase PulO-like enzyme (type II secretory pathway)
MKAKYKHTQYGAWMFVVFLVTGILIAVVGLTVMAEGRMLSAILMICVYILGLVMFYSFTVEISEEQLKFWFGIGVIRKAVALSEIHSTKEIKNPWYYGWGVKSIPGGWFYAIAPGSAVEIELKNGRIVQVGTNQSKQLKQAIDTAKQQVSNM